MRCSRKVLQKKCSESKNIKKKMLSYIVVLLVLVFICAAPYGKASESIPSNVDIDASSSEPLYVVLGGIQSPSSVLNLINKTLNENGIQLIFEQFPGTAKYVESYTSYIRQKILGGENNRVYLVPPGMNIDMTLQDEGMLGDFYQEAFMYAPKYMERQPDVYFNDPSTLIRIPTNFRKVTPRVPVVLVRKDIAQAYGSEIGTGSDYIALLEWLKEYDPDSIPGAALADIWGMAAYMPLDLLLPEYGYSNVGQTLCYLEINTGRVLPTWSLPESRYALKEYARLRRDGLLHLANTTAQNGGAFKNYATILLYAYDLVEDMSLYTVSGFIDLDVSEYMAYALYNNQIPIPTIIGSESIWSPTFAIAGPDTDIREFMKFLEWLEEPEHYWRLFYGVETVDYNSIDDRIEFLRKNSDYEIVRTILTYFERSELKAMPLTAPENYETTLANIQSAYDLVLTDETYEMLNNWENGLDEVEQDELDGYWNDLREMNRLLFITEVLDAKRTSEVIDEFIEKQERREPLMLEYAQIMEEAINDNGDIP